MSKLYKSLAERNQRNQHKIQAVIDRLGFYDPDFPNCDYCNKRRGTQYHERISRSATIGRSSARDLSYVPELCNLLCSTCHNLADTYDVDVALWEFAIKLYGRKKVKEAFDRLNDMMRIPLVVGVMYEE